MLTRNLLTKFKINVSIITKICIAILVLGLTYPTASLVGNWAAYGIVNKLVEIVLYEKVKRTCGKSS